MISITAAPRASGTHPPSTTFSKFAARNVTSTNTKGAMSAAAASGVQRQSFQTTKKAIVAVTTIVPVTEIP
jgi:hypothetical protein